MKARFFLITVFAPFVLYFLGAQSALTMWNLYGEYDDAVNSLEFAVMLEDSVSDSVAQAVCLKVSELTGNKARISSSEQQMERFRSMFGVDVIGFLSENPLPVTVISAIGRNSDPVVVKTAVSKIQGVCRAAYPDSRRSALTASYNDRCIRMTILDVILAFAIILQAWMSERLEGAANEHLMRGVPYRIRRMTFHRRSFIKGTVSGILAAAAFMLLHEALQMNHDVLPDPGYDRCITISCAVVAVSALLTYFMQLLAFPIANKNTR